MDWRVHVSDNVRGRVQVQGYQTRCDIVSDEDAILDEISETEAVPSLCLGSFATCFVVDFVYCVYSILGSLPGRLD